MGEIKRGNVTRKAWENHSREYSDLSLAGNTQYEMHLLEEEKLDNIKING